MKTKLMETGGYRYIPGVMQYSAGVCANEGYRIVRARFADVVPLEEGFKRIADHLESVDRPLQAFCACELRSPGQFSEQDFRSFNELYAGTLRHWDIMEGDENPIARSNVCPEIDPPAAPGFHSFLYTVRDEDAPKTFAIAGSGEVPEGAANYHDHIIRPGETSPDAIREKAAFVLDEMERRMAFFDANWAETTAAQIYTVHEIHPLMTSELGPRGAHHNGLIWHFNRPPIAGLDYEMDCRRVFDEFVLA